MNRKSVLRAVAALAVVWLGFSAAVHADETCNSPYISKLIKGQEDYVYVWALGVEGLGDGSDKLVTVDVNPKSKSYGKVIHSVSTGARAEAHHMGFTDDRRHIWAGDIREIYTSTFLHPRTVLNDIETLLIEEGARQKRAPADR
jgi:selenium-binding protein 1